MERRFRHWSRLQHHDIAPSLFAVGVQAQPTSSTRSLLNATVLVPLLVVPLVEEVQRAQNGARLRERPIRSNEAQGLSMNSPCPGKTDEERRDRRYAPFLLCEPLALTRLVSSALHVLLIDRFSPTAQTPDTPCPHHPALTHPNCPLPLRHSSVLCKGAVAAATAGTHMQACYALRNVAFAHCMC